MLTTVINAKLYASLFLILLDETNVEIKKFDI